MRVSVGGVDAFVHTGGEPLTGGNELVLLIHGAGNDHVIWRYATRRMAAGKIAVAAPDLPAHGNTSGPALESIEAMAEWCEELVDVLGFSSVIPVGHSMGSLVAMQLACRVPTRVDRVGLIATAEQIAVHPVLQAAADQHDRLAIDLIVGWTHSGRSRFGHHQDPGRWMAGVNRRLLERNAGALGTDLRACAAWDGAEAFCALGMPTLVVVGQFDRMTNPRSASSLADRCNATVVEVANGSHASLYDHPREVIDPLIDWLGAE